MSPSPDPTALIEQLNLLVANPTALELDETQRNQIRVLSCRAAGVLDSPFQAFQKITYGGLQVAALRIGQSHGICSQLLEVEANEPVSLEELAIPRDIKPVELELFLDYMCTQDMVKEVTPRRYAATDTTHLMVTPLYTSGCTLYHEADYPVFGTLGRWLHSPPSVCASVLAFSMAHNSDDDLYAWLAKRPDTQRGFNEFMSLQFSSWLDHFDFEATIRSSSSSELHDGDIIFVDIAGGIGHQCQALKVKLPHLPGRVVLQDRPVVLESALAVEGVEKMAYDYFTEQPLKGAKVYYFRQILHNNTDENCIRILQSQIPAMNESSVIILDEKVLSDEKLSADDPDEEFVAGLSILMLGLFNSLERREAHWRQLLDAAGLKILEIKRYSDFDGGLIMAAKK